MKMSLAYMEATAAHMASKGWQVTRTEKTHERDGQLVFVAHQFALARGDGARFEMETLVYADETLAYYLAIAAWHGLSVTSYPLDSWKHRPDKVEFKFAISPDSGLGLSFIVQLPDPPPA